MSTHYSVQLKSKETVAAALPLQEHWLPLSNLDLLLPPLDVGVFLCYKNNPAADFDSRVDSLKASLAQALATFYPFAGEVVANSAGEPELLCNNRGVDFHVACADLDLWGLNLYDPDESVEKKLVPKKEGGVVCVQVTGFSCGGVAVACTFDHRVADAYSANMFLVAWSEIAMKRSGWVAPCFRRSLLSPRRPGCYDEFIDRLYVPISTLKMKPPVDHHDADANGVCNETINRIYYISSENIDKMQAEAAGRSKLEAFSAYIWQLIGKATKKSNIPNYKVCRMGMVVNGRSRLQHSAKAMARYFGNVLTIPYGTINLSELEEMNLTEVADTVHEFVHQVATEEHFLSLVDWVEAHRPEPAATRIYFNEENDGVNFVISSGRDFPVTRLEFGMGKPVFGSYHFPWGGSAGYVMPMPSAKGNGDWVVYVHLMRGLVEEIEAAAGDVFCALTSEYVML